ncbi:hypothetical protein GQR58_028830 [Nymphon striatum]|nr:hypothetical protein GQR58_028830 [Nymphon striatum]
MLNEAAGQISPSLSVVGLKVPVKWYTCISISSVFPFSSHKKENVPPVMGREFLNKSFKIFKVVLYSVIVKVTYNIRSFMPILTTKFVSVRQANDDYPSRIQAAWGTFRYLFSLPLQLIAHIENSMVNQGFLWAYFTLVGYLLLFRIEKKKFLIRICCLIYVLWIGNFIFLYTQ